MAESLGTIRGQMILDVKQTLAAYTSARSAHITTVTALHAGAGALAISGAAMAGVGIAMGAGILVAVDAASEFEKKLDYFGAVSASTQAEYDAIREKALQLGADTIFSADQIAGSFVELGKAGVSASDIINGVGEAVSNLGAAADIPLDTAANIIMSAVQTFGLSAQDSIGVADKLAGAANASIVEVEDLGTSLKYAGGVAASLGIPFEDVNTAIALLGTYGIRGSTAGTSLRRIMLSLGGATPKATTALRELGIITEDGTNKFYDAAGSAKPLAEIFQILQEATAGLSDKQKVAALNTIFQNRALASAIGLTTEGAAGFDTMAAAIDKTTAAEVAGKRLNNLAGDLEVLQGNIDTLLITSGSSMQDFARGIIQGITGVIQAFADLPKGVQSSIVIIIAVIAVILTIVGVFSLFAGAILNLVALAITLGPVFAAIASAIGTARVAVQLFGLALMANPIGLIIGLIALLIGALVWFFTQTEVGREAWSAFVQFLGEAWANIVSFATTTFTNLSSFFSDVWNNIVGFFEGAIAFIIDMFMTWHPLGMIISNWEGIVNFFTTLWTNITTGIVNFITGAIGFFQSLPTRVAEFFTALPGMIGYALGFILGNIVRIFLEIGTWLTTNVPLIITNVVNFFMALPGQIIQFFTDLYNGAVLWFTNLAIQAIILATQIYTNIVTWIQQVPEVVAQFFNDMYTRALAIFMQLILGAMKLGREIYTNITTFIGQVPAAVLGFFQQVQSNITTWFGKAVAVALGLAKDIYNNIRNGIEGIPGLVTGIFNNVVSAIKGVIGRAVRAVTDFASGLWEGFKDGLGIHSPSYIEHAMWAITDVLDDETQHMKKQVRVIQGLGNGISEVGNNLGNGFGTSMNKELISLQAQMASARGLEASFSSGQVGSQAGVEMARAESLASIGETLKGLKVGETIYDIDIINPVPEQASESLPRSIRKAAYVS